MAAHLYVLKYFLIFIIIHSLFIKIFFVTIMSNIFTDQKFVISVMHVSGMKSYENLRSRVPDLV